MHGSSPSETSDLEFAFPSTDTGARDVAGEGESRWSDELVDGEWTKLYHQTSHHSPGQSGADKHLNRASPMPASVRFSHQHNSPREQQPQKSILDSWLSRRSSVHSANTASHAAHSNPSSSHGHTPSLNSKLKGKDRSLDSALSSPVGFGFGHDPDHVVSPTSNPSASYTSHEQSSRIIPIIPRPSSNQGPPQRKQRTSLLVAATDVLGLRKKLGSVSRKKAPPHLISSLNCIPDIIEINAHSDTTITTTVAGTVSHMDLENEERERLRDAAAQSIGLDCLHEPRKWDSLLSFDPPDPQEYPQLPSFPTTLGALDSMTQMSATLPKFTPASSLLVYALAKQWKVRTLVLTSNVVGHKAHVHLFKSASLNEVEMERLEITEDSAMFLAEEEVGGRKNVIKLVGKDVGTKKHVNGSSHTSGSTEDSARAMWFLQFTAREESQHWIAAIKNAVLNQRSVRAGLAIPASNGGYGPSGDMDVILSMRMRGIASPQPSRKVSSSPSSTQSLRSLVLNAQSLPPSSAARDIMTSTRSRSPSLDSPHSPLVSQAHTEESFGAMGTNLLTMFRGNTASESSSSPACSLPVPLPHGQAQGSPAASVRSASTTVIIPGSDLKISKERDAPSLSISPPSLTSTPPGTITPPNAFQASMNSVPLPLQPPPRKARCHLTVPPPTAKRDREGLYNHPGNNRSVAGNFGVHPTEVLPPTPSLVVMPSETLPPRNVSPGPFAATDLPDTEPPFSASCNANGQPPLPSPPLAAARSLSPDLGVPASFDTCSGSSSSSQRWLRKISTLPHRPAPPSGPPPSVPEVESAQPALHLHVPHPYAADELASSVSSNSRTDISPHSASSLAQSLWKRASTSSAYSVNSWSTSDSRAIAEPTTTLSASILSLPNPTGSKIAAPKRRSMPPPRPAPTHAPPPAPIAEGVVVPQSPPPPKQQPSPDSPPQAPKPLRASVAQRALRLSLTSPKPPPSTSLPPRPDEPGFFRGHRRSSSNSTAEGPRISSDLPSIPGSPPHSPSRLSTVGQPRPPSSASSVRSLSIKQRLRLLSAPSSTSPPPTPSGSNSPLPSTQQQSQPPQIQTQTKTQTKVQKQVPGPHDAQTTSTLDFDDDDDDDDPRTPSHVQPSRPPFGLGEHIMDINDPSFLSLTPIESPTAPHLPPRSPFRPLSAGGPVNPGTPMIEGEFEFMALSPPPPRRGSKHISVSVAQPEKSSESELPAFTKTAVSPNPQVNTLAALSARGSVVSLGYITM